jgi:hypothetical protein
MQAAGRLALSSKCLAQSDKSGGLAETTKEGPKEVPPVSSILKIVDRTDQAIRRAVFAVLDGLAAVTTQTDYSHLLQERRARSTVMFVGGYPVRRIQTRFGDVYAVIGTNSAFATLAEAEAHARKLARGRADQ